MKSITKFLIGIFICVNYIFAQSSDTPVLSYFNGGTLNLNVKVGLNSSGITPNAGTFGGILSPSLKSGIYSVFGNPAEMANYKKAQFTFDGNFGLSTSTFGMGKNDLVSDKDIADGTDSFLEDTTTFIYKPENFRSDTKVNSLDITFRKGGIGSFAALIPFADGWSFGVAYAEPINLAMNMSLSNLNLGLKTTKSVADNETSIDFVLNNQLNSQLALRMNQLTFSFGGTIFGNERTDRLNFGIGLSRYEMTNNIDFSFYSDGAIILNNANEYYFNDPSDVNLSQEKGETNNLFWKAKGNFNSHVYGFKLGFELNTRETIPFMNFSLMYEYVPKFNMQDPNAINESYQPKFFTGRLLGENDESLDIIIDSLSLTKPNLTVATSNPFSDEVNISLPSSLTFGFDFKLGDHTIALNILKYFNEYSYQLGKFKFGKKPSAGFKLGFDFKFPSEYEGWDWALIPVRLLYMDFDGLLFQIFSDETLYSNPHFRFGGGLIFGDAIAEGFGADNQKSLEDGLALPLPSGFALGKTYRILDRLTISTVVYGYPDIFLKYSFAYEF